MAILAKEERTFEAIPAGMQQAVCAGVYDIGSHVSNYQGVQKKNHKIIVLWELDEKKKEGEFAGNPFQISKFYTLSLDQKANLRKDLESWRGKPFTQEELQGFDVETLVGANCFLNIIHENEKSKISAITPISKNMVKISATPKLAEPDWIKKMRDKSVEVAGMPTKENVTTANEDDLPF